MQDLELVGGPPLLVRPAMDAVRQWRFKPARPNGEPIEVETTISVVFSFWRYNLLRPNQNEILLPSSAVYIESQLRHLFCKLNSGNDK